MTGESKSSARSRLTEARGVAFCLALVVAAWAVFTWPLARGERTLFARDVFSVHLGQKAFGIAELRAGRIPATDPAWGLGQPFRGNPNVLPFYPGNALYVLFPFWSAFNLHFALHWLMSFLTLFALARRLGLGPQAALLAGLTYSGGGLLVTSLTIYNLMTLCAWWPLALLGAARGDRRGLAIAGLAVGMSVLGGEPVSLLLVLPTLPLVAHREWGRRRFLPATAAILALGLLLSLPQVVATIRLLDYTVRTRIGYVHQQFAFHPLRLLELLVPLPFGQPHDLGWDRFLSGSLARTSPFFFTIHIGLAGLVLALAGLRREPRWAIIGASGLFLATLHGEVATLLIRMTANIFRYPERFLLLFFLAAALLAGRGLDAVLAGEARPARLALALAAASIVLSALALTRGRDLLAALAESIPVADLTLIATRHALHLAGALLVSAALLLAIAVAAWRRNGWVLLLLQALSLGRLHSLVPTDDVAFYATPSDFTPALDGASDVLMGSRYSPFEEPAPTYRVPNLSTRAITHIDHLDLHYVTGTIHGLRYPLAADLEGLDSPAIGYLRYGLPSLDWEGRVRWLRTLGISHLTLVARGERTSELDEVHRVDRFAVPTGLYRVRSPAPDLWWPERVEVEADRRATLLRVARTPDPVAIVLAAEAVAHAPGARIAKLHDEADRIEVTVAGEGGLLVLRRAYLRIWRARAGDRPLRTMPVNLVLLGVEVPAGSHTVVLEVSSLPERLAGLGVIAALALCIGLWRRPT